MGLWRWSISLYGRFVKGTWKEDTLLVTLEDRWKRLWRWASLSIGAPLENLEGTHLPGILRDG